MNYKSLIELTKCRVREFRREPSAFAFVLTFPVLMMVVLGLVFNSTEPAPKLVGFTPEAFKTPEVQSLLERASELKSVSASAKELKTKMTRGSIHLIVDYKEKNSQKDFEYTFDSHSPEGELTYLFTKDRLVQSSASAPAWVKNVSTPGSRYVDFLIPGLLAFSMMSTSMFGTGMVMVVNRREKLLKKYLTTPMKASTYILSHIIGRQMIMFIEWTIIMVAGYVIFDFTVQGSLLLFFLTGMLGTLMFTVMAMLIGAKTDNAGAYNGLSNLAMLPMLFLCGIWYSKYHFPDWLQTLSGALPLSPLVDSLREIANQNTGAAAVASAWGVMALYTVLFSVATKLRFRWY